MKLLIIGIILIGIVFYTIKTQNNPVTANTAPALLTQNNPLAVATFAGGCFWCVEAVFQRIDGVLNVIPGYAGGHVKNPSYREICTGKTGHAEVARIEFDPNIISYKQLLNVFWQAHDPTTLNKQGADIGTQYRSVIFYHSEEQKAVAEKSIKSANESKYWPNPIQTEITEINSYTDAEDYHDNYYNENPNQPYCQFVIKPKLDKLEKLGIID